MKFLEVPTTAGLVLVSVAQIVAIGTNKTYGTYIETVPTSSGEEGLLFTPVPYATLRRELVMLLGGSQVFHSFCEKETP
jgi:hypothetical protein